MNFLIIDSNPKSKYVNNTENEIKPLKPLIFTNEYLQQIHPNKTLIVAVTEEKKFYKLEGTEKKHFELPFKVKKISQGWEHYLILLENNHVYTYGTNNSDGQLGIRSITKTKKPTKLDFFDDLKVVDIFCGFFFSFILVEGGELYGWGRNDIGCLGNGKSENVYKPTLIHNGVKQYITSGYSHHSFYFDTNDALYGFGSNSPDGRIGLGVAHKRESIRTPQKVPLKFDYSEIQNIICGNKYSLLLTKDKKLYTSGASYDNGLPQQTSEFTLIPYFSNNNIKPRLIQTGCNYTVVLDEENYLYHFGKSSPDISNIKRLCRLEERIESISCGVSFEIFLKIFSNVIAEDFLELLEMGLFTDGEIFNCKVHKLLFEIRFNKQFVELKKKFEERFLESEFQQVLQWVYGDKPPDTDLEKKIIEILEIKKLPINNFPQDMEKLYKNEETKDFSIILGVNDDDDEDNDNDNDDEDIVNLKVHKIVLAARSKLFREMFQSIQNNIQQINDYSQISIDSFEILIEFFYTGKIRELTADDDSEFIIEELQDATQYYQLNKNSNLDLELNLLKNKN
ncbi:hypothetical protein M0813_17963 [Anaeramoeba flamelloides]|uniref:BTB domain-containing protein n=1 Tax=Anaeramoeba flamelloides TaxID=1746091 RepID=A0ABQ8YUJ3_9EUKA|nr:hypothetical protein M0813_17963 [Anaeramoeba flamelloides]